MTGKDNKHATKTTVQIILTILVFVLLPVMASTNFHLK